MYVGVILLSSSKKWLSLCIPHVRGGDPTSQSNTISPAWVFPMYVGVILMVIAIIMIRSSIPHVRGGDPNAFSLFQGVSKYSPCTWG